MALLWCDGYDWWTGTTAAFGGHGPADMIYEKTNGYAFKVGGRHGGNYCDGFNAQSLRKSIANTVTLVIGSAYNFHASVGGDVGLMAGLDSGQNQWSLNYRAADSKLVLTRGGIGLIGAVVIAATALTWPSAPLPVWHYVEVKVTTGAAAAYEVRVDGAVVLAGVGNTQATANAYCNQFCCTTSSYCDDSYVCDTSGPRNNDFLGDVSVYALSPNADGYLVEWTPSVLPTNWQNVALPVGYLAATGYNVSTGVGKIDSYNMGALPQDGTIFGVMTLALLQRDDAVFHTVRTFLRTGGINYESGDFVMSNGYLGYAYMYEVNPGTGVAWVKASIDALEAGVRDTA